MFGRTVNTSMDITCTLFAAQSMDLNLRSGAEAILKQFQEQNLSNFLLSLSAELSSDAKPPASRVLAGIILKNSLDSKDSEKKELLIQQWVNLDASVKVEIKKSLLTTLGSLVAVARHVTSQVIAKVASIEIPRGECPDLIGILLHNLREQAASAPLKQATLEVFGYVFQDIHPQNLDQDQANVLTAVVQVASEAHLSSEVRLTAVKVLYSALDFAASSFAEYGERSYIMNSIIGTAVSEDKDIRAASFECLVAIASKYYMHLEPYISDILRLTAEALKDDKSVALQAIEFWCNICICEEQLEVQETCTEFDDANSVVNCHFIELTFRELVPMLLGTLLKQEEDKEQEGSARKVSTSGMVCLGLIARTLGDVVLPDVMEFIDVNIVGPEWYCRRAATFALVSILVGPSVEKLVPLVLGKLDCLLNRMKDADREEKATIARTLGQVFEILHSPASANTIITDQNCHHIMNVLLESSKDDPEVSEKVFGAIYFLAKGYQDAELLPSELTPYIEQAIKALVSALDRAGKTNFSLRASAYRALNEIVRVSKIHENSDSIGQLLYDIMERLNGTFDFPIQSADDVRNQNDLQASLCVLLQVIIHKLSNLVDSSIIPVAADNLMLLFFRVFNHRTCGSTVHDKAMLATGALAYAIGQDFEKHMPKLLLNYNEYQLTPLSLGVLGNICHVLEHQMLMFSGQVMNVLKKALSNPMLDRSVKPAIFLCFGDLALAIGEHFEEYLRTVMKILLGDADLGIDKEDVDYRNQIRWAICRACSGILNGFKGPKAQLIEPYLRSMFSFFQNVRDDKISDKRVACAAIAALHDLQATIASRTQGMIDQLGALRTQGMIDQLGGYDFYA